jgi:quercetin dioxygenase-like cupin family protein
MSAGAQRRVITGHDGSGKAIIIADEQLAGSGLAEDEGRTDATFFNLWATREMPVDNSDAALDRQREGSRPTIVGSGAGTVLRIGLLGPGLRSPMHRTQSLDYGICLDGECDLELDSGAVVTLKAGDVVIQRGTSHVWHNRSAKPCMFAWILLDAAPVVVDGRPLGTSWTEP